MEFRVNPGILGRYKNLNYSPWYAIAEFVDNSLHSFVENKDKLDSIGTSKLNVSISYDANESGTLRVIDNSTGMTLEELEDALEVGRPKATATTQLSEFGMGMKTSAIWLGNKLSIKTKHFSESVERTVTIDISEIVNSNMKVNVSERNVANSTRKSYTIIEVSEHNRKFQGRTLGVIQDVLKSMYSKYIQSGIMDLHWGDSLLEPELLTPMRTNSGNVLKKDFEFAVNGKKVTGYVGILEKGSGKKAGFSIYRNNRLIQGYPETNFKPREIFSSEGGTNNTVNQRVYGELLMDGFEVTHTKDGISYQGDEEKLFREELKKHSNYFINIANQGLDEIRSMDGSVNTSSSSAQIIKQGLDEDLENDKFIQAYDELELEVSATLESVPEFIEQEAVDSNLLYERTFSFDRGRDVKHIKVFLSEGDTFAPYLTIDENFDEAVLRVIINVRHPFVRSVKEKGNESFKDFLLQCSLDALAENKLMHRDSGTIIPSAFRIAKNTFLKIYSKS